MRYVSIIWAAGLPSPEDLAVIQRELPAWVDDVNARGIRLIGRELDLPDTGVTVRVRDGETLVTDGPFAETKEFVAGFDVDEFAGRDEAIQVAESCPISWFQAIEVRPFTGGVPLSEQALAFGRAEDGGATPYLLGAWAADSPTALPDDKKLVAECESWRQDVRARGVHVLGNELGGRDTATTVRVRDGKTVLSAGPSGATGEFMTSIDVVSCADRQQAINLAAAHPAARYHSVEVRPFYQG